VVTIYDVADVAGVSPATVSRVLNGRANVNAAMAEKVRDVAAKLDYRPNAVARNLRRASTNMWAVLISDIENPFFTSLVRGIEDVAQAAKYSVVLCNTDENPDKEAAYISAIRAEQMSGVIISPSGWSDSVRELHESTTPMVVIDRRIAGIEVDTVLVDNVYGAGEATRHLVAQGFRSIACITGPRGIATADERVEGYRQALTDNGMEFRPELLRYADFRRAGGRSAMRDILAGPYPPDAVFAANNVIAVGVLECLSEAGMRVPDDIGMVGFDEIPWAHLVRPGITTIAQPTYELGRTAARLLQSRLAAPHRETSIVTLPTELQVRESSTRVPRVAAEVIPSP